MKTHWKIPVVFLQFLPVLVLLLGTQVVVKADQFDEIYAAYQAGNYQKAFKLLKPLAEQGDALAQPILGFMYDDGEGVPQDYAEAVKLYRKAAEQGDADAQLNLGIMYVSVNRVPQDYVQAHKWINLSASCSQGKIHEDSFHKC
jgi:TPR repeat protein